MTACREHKADVKKRPKEVDAALNRLTISRDSRIAEAASKVDGILRDRMADPRAPAFSRYGVYVRIVADDPAVP